MKREVKIVSLSHSTGLMILHNKARERPLDGHQTGRLGETASCRAVRRKFGMLMQLGVVIAGDKFCRALGAPDGSAQERTATLGQFAPRRDSFIEEIAMCDQRRSAALPAGWEDV